ncbi:MAG: anthranilate phosphoribosyltransferase [Candidatus Eisenbacteria bacterium]|nr:anthranilate phosphoribosyltransferase [Candidatus Eisenbacteria bacterium]
MSAGAGDPHIVRALARVAEGGSLSKDESRDVLAEVMRGEATPAQIGAFLMGMRMKGETSEELAGAAEAMRAVASRVTTSRTPLLDTCGTGGDGSGTYNVSTAVALVAAAAGANVAKHGNRSVSSKSGSADVLERLGLRLDLDADQMGRCLDEVGIAFLFAPALHGAMRHAIGPRREMKLRTLFNLLGPLTNPAGAGRQLLGVYDRGRARQVAEVLAMLGTERAWVVHGLEGLDELSVVGPSVVFDVANGEVEERELDPKALGFPAVDPAELAGGTPEENADWMRKLLEGREVGGSRQMVVLNTAAALVVTGRVDDLSAGRELAEETLKSGAGAELLTRLVEVARSL